jgi:hypothetical protein
MIHQEEPRERPQPAQEPGGRRLLPHETQVCRPSEEEDQVQLPITQHLVGEVTSIRAAGEANPRTIAHHPSLCGHPRTAAPLSRRCTHINWSEVGIAGRTNGSETISTLGADLHVCALAGLEPAPYGFEVRQHPSGW